MDKNIKITETGVIKIKPNLMIINFTLKVIDLNYSLAIEKAQTETALLRKTIEKVGFNKNDLKTISFNVNARYENINKPDGSWVNEFVGFECIHSLRLAFDYNQLTLGMLIEKVANSEVDPEINIEFSLKDDEKIINLAINKAIDNAKIKALHIANQLEVNLKEIISIEYDKKNNSSVVGLRLTEFMMEMIPEDLSVEQQITIIWSIK